MKFLSALIVSAFFLITFSACSGPQPAEWSQADWPNTQEEVSRSIISILTKRLGYQIEEYEEYPEERLITFRTSWNTRNANKAIFAGTGTRRMAFVEIQEIYSDTAHIELPPSVTGNESDDDDRPRFHEVTLESGERRMALTQIAISIRQERNTNIVNPEDISKGEWRDYGTDKEEIEQILAMLRTRLDEISGREFEMSEKASKAHEKYIRDGLLTPEERRKRYDDLTGGQ